MDNATVMLLFGCVLSLIAILGGGFEVQYLKIPTVGRVPRCLAGVFGIVFIGLGIGAAEVRKQRLDAPPVAQAMVAAPAPVSFTVNTQLSGNQVSEQSTILVNSKVVGQLAVNKHYPDAMISVDVPAPGRYSYTIDARIVINEGGQLVERAGVGQGMIDVAPGKRFELQYAESGNTIVVALAE